MIYQLKRLIYLLSIFAALIVQASEQAADTQEESSESTEIFQEYAFSSWRYYSATPVTVDDHLAKMSERLGRDMYWPLNDAWNVRVKQENLKQLSPLDDNWGELRQRILDILQDNHRLSNCHYEGTRKHIIDYVDPNHLPKELSWWFGILFAHYGNTLKELAIYDSEPTLNNQVLAPAKVLDLYKLSLLFFSYSLGLSDSSPSILQHSTLSAILSDSEITSKLDSSMQKEFAVVDEEAWVQAIQPLDQQRIEHICMFFRTFYHFFLQNREALPRFYLSLAANLNSLTTKIFLTMNRANDNFNLDAVHPWMFRLYIDLKKWEILKQQEPSITTPDLVTLLPQMQRECLRLMPHPYTLEEITEENEYEICQKVRMRNLLPTIQGDLNKGEKIIDEFEFSPAAMRHAFIGILYFFDDRARFANGFDVAIKQSNEVTQQIYNYLSGYVEMDALPITEDNALKYLLYIKLFDAMTEVWNSHYHVDYEYFGGIYVGFRGFNQFYFPRSTFELRKHILQLCPLLKSFEALTVSVNPQKVRDEKDQINPEAWVDESDKLRQKCVEDLRSNAQYLSDMMDQSPLKGKIVGTRGISGCGKSTFIKANILPLIAPQGKSDQQQIALLAQGILNPDIIKAALRKLQGGTLNTQVHSEGANAFQKLFKEIADNGSYILDKRHLTPYDIVSNLVDPAKYQNSCVWLYDFDIPIAACASRILTRPLHGDDPCPEYEVLVDGLLAIRRHRTQVIALALKEETIAKYELYATCKQCLVAHKQIKDECPLHVQSEGFLCIHDPHLFQECLKEPTYQEIEEELSQVINEVFIAQAIDNGYIATEQREFLEKWLGLTLKEAIQQYVQKGKNACDECFFEPAEVLPFNGKEWLADLPQLIEYLNCEHCLHTRGVDETGRGLHWEVGQLGQGLNPKYSPEAKAPSCHYSGIQIKVGYFIVPMKNLDLLLSENLSPEVSRELTVRDENGELIGLRFFTHPEAYAHFAPLLQASIQFVPPSQSEYMGTPTSSYQSWLIRNIKTSNRKPFIVKMGMSNGSADLKHLLAADDIVKSLSYQKRLDKLIDKPDFVLFKETAGIILKEIPGYPAGTIDSGIVISELPEPLLKGECKLFSFSSLMSCERVHSENQGIAALNPHDAEKHKLPLIYELIDIAIQKDLVKTPEEFLRVYFIDAYLKAIEPIVFKEGYSILSQGNNLYLVLNSDNTIRGFAFRDLEGLVLKKRFLESYSWFYRYANFTKLLNVLTYSESDAADKTASERNLYYYLSTMFAKQEDGSPLDALRRLSITSEENLKLLQQLDASYLKLLKGYFKIDEAHILNSDSQTLWENRIPEDE